MEDGKGAEEDGFKVGSSIFALVFHKEACGIFFYYYYPFHEHLFNFSMN